MGRECEEEGAEGAQPCAPVSHSPPIFCKPHAPTPYILTGDGRLDKLGEQLLPNLHVFFEGVEVSFLLMSAW